MRYPDAKHQNMAGVTHPVAAVQELLHKVKQAGANSPLEYSTDVSQAMRDALSPDGPSPAITIGDNIHWRVMLINAKRKHVDFVDPFGTGFLHSVKTSVQRFYQSDNTGTWTFTEWTKRLQPRGDTWNCGIWAIWIQEKWMQYWSQTEATNAFADWLDDIDMTPEGQALRQHYHVVMQIAGTAAEDGTTDLCQSREISAARMANQRDKQALHETYKECMHTDAIRGTASTWQRNTQSPIKIPDSPGIQATGSRHTQSKKVATTQIHRTLGKSLSSLHTSMRMHGKIHKKLKPTQTASTGRLLSWLQGESNTSNTGEVHHDREEAGVQHNTTSGTASCKPAVPDHSKHAHKPGSIQADFANAILKENATKQQLAPENTVNTRSPTALQKPPAEDSITVDKEMDLQQNKIDSDCNISLDTTTKACKARQASTLSESCRANMTSHTDKQPATTQEKKRKVAGAYHPCCDTLTVLTWNVMGSTTVPDELMQIVQQRKPWIIRLTETKLTDARQDRVFFQDYLPEYTLYHSCVKGNDSGHCRTGSGGVAIAVHKSLTSQNSVELIDHNNPAAKSHLKTLRIKPPGSDCLTIWGVYLPSNNLQKRQELYQVITDCVRSEDKKASLAGLPDALQHHSWGHECSTVQTRCPKSQT